MLVAARAHGLRAIDGPYLGVEADAEFVAAVTRARDVGFDGKWAIHPKQLTAMNEAFTPTPAEVAAAREVLSALAGAQRDTGIGAMALAGHMLDEAVRAAAVRTLVRAGENP